MNKVYEEREKKIGNLLKENKKLNNFTQKNNTKIDNDYLIEENSKLSKLLNEKEKESQKWRKKYFENSNLSSSIKPNLNKVELLIRENEKLNQLLEKKDKKLLEFENIETENKNLTKILKKKHEELDRLKERYNKDLIDFEHFQSIANAALSELESYKIDNEKLTNILEENYKEIEFFKELELKAEILLEENEKFKYLIQEKESENEKLKEIIDGNIEVIIIDFYCIYYFIIYIK